MVPPGPALQEKPIPTPGQIVEARQRQWVTLDVARSTLEADPLQPQRAAQHFVSLSSIEDDALGESLQVIWELEPGVHIREQTTLPTPESGFDEPQWLDTFLNAVRWGAVSSANVRMLQAPFRSGVTIEDYQLDPVVRALSMPRVNLLIADDVGLGKTIEAGLVAQELLLRHRARTILIVCPASLQVQWSEQMRDKFGLEFRIADSALLKQLRRQRGLHVNPWVHFPRLITSIDFLKRERPMQLMREVLPAAGESPFPRRFDLLIVDEAHNVAPSGVGRYAIDSLRTQAIRTLTPHFEHRLFLSATPHNGYRESFAALLELLDNQRFTRRIEPDPRQLERIMVRRLKSELPPHWDGTPRFPKRELIPLEVAATEAERRAHQQLREYTALREQGSRDEAESVATQFVTKLLKKRLLSSPAAFRDTLAKHWATLNKERAAARTSKARPAPGILRARIEGIEDDFGDDAEYETVTEELVDTATRLFHALSDQERVLLEQLQQYAERASTRPDTKAQALIDWLETHLRPGGNWGQRRVLIFTEYRSTQKWLHDLLVDQGYARDERMKLLYGGVDSDTREAVKAAFQADPEASKLRILLATDAASEGLDLQNHCADLIHYEIPWNPNRLEQRNGRIDRHGQRASEVRIHHFVSAGYRQRVQQQRHLPVGDLDGDLEFLMRVADKVKTIREDLGTVGPVLARQVEEAMLGKRQSINTQSSEQKAGRVRKRLTFERNLADQLDKLLAQLNDTRRELSLTPDNIRQTVTVALELAGHPPLKPVEVAGIWPDPKGTHSTCPVFELPALSGSWARCAEGLEHPHTKQLRPIVFDHDLARGRDDVVLVHLNHRLVQMALHLLRAEVWAGTGRRKLHRVTARLVPGSALDTPAVIAHGRIVVLGGDNHRLHEEIISAGGYLREGRFARITGVNELQRLLEQGLPQAAPQAMRARLATLWAQHGEPLLNALEARMRERTKNLESRLNERRDRETNDITQVMNELARTIERELADDDPQIPLDFNEQEQDQWQRDRDNLRARLERIPDEIEQETRAIQARYADPQARLFPVAVTYLMPESLA